MAAEIQFNVDQALAKLSELIQQHGPQAVETAAQVVRIDAVNTLTGVVGWGILALVSARAAHWCFRRGQDHDEAWQVAAVGAALVAGGFLFGSLLCLFDVWAWVALFNPKLALAHAILAKLGA